MQSFSIISEVCNGRISDNARRAITEKLAFLEGKQVMLTIEKFVRNRSSNQNRFMHGPFFKAMIAAHAEAGEILTLDEIKDIFKRDFGIKKTVRTITGEYIEIPVSTRKYSTIQCEECMEKARAKYAEFNHYLPFPNEGLYGNA